MPKILNPGGENVGFPDFPEPGVYLLVAGHEEALRFESQPVALIEYGKMCGRAGADLDATLMVVDQIGAFTSTAKKEAMPKPDRSRPVMREVVQDD